MVFPELPGEEKAVAYYRSQEDIVAVVVTEHEVKFYIWDGVSNNVNQIYYQPRLYEVRGDSLKDSQG